MATAEKGEGFFSASEFPFLEVKSGHVTNKDILEEKLSPCALFCVFS